jgi:YggT family protein
MGLLYDVLSTILNLYSIAVIIYVFMSWFPNSRETPIGYFLGRIVEPYLEPFRRFIPPIGMIDISPIVALFVLHLAKIGLQQLFIMLLY